MDSEKLEKIVSETIIFAGKVFTVRDLEIQLPEGDIVHWEIVDKGGSSVAMVAVDGNGHVHLVEEYYGAANKRLLSLPKGSPEPNEDMETAALRELQEEIGYTGRIRPLLTTEVSPSYLRQVTHIFLVTDLRRSRMHGDEEAYLQERVLPLALIESDILEGRITESRTIAGLLLAKRVLGI